MANSDEIRHGSQVLGSDGGMVGLVDGVEGERIKLQRAAEAGGGGHHFVPIDWVDRVDDHVHLNVDAATVRDRWGTEAGAAAAGTGYAATAGAATADDGRTNWLPWIIGALLLLALLFFGLKGCDGRDNDTAAGDDGTVAAGAAASDSAFNRDVETYLASSEALPRTFAFDKLEFDTASAEVRAADRADLTALAGILAARPGSRVKVVGYADARGAADANRNLGLERAQAVAAMLTAGGLATANIETESGGESNPAATNETAPGQQENRRTELVVLAR